MRRWHDDGESWEKEEGGRGKEGRKEEGGREKRKRKVKGKWNGKTGEIGAMAIGLKKSTKSERR